MEAIARVVRTSGSVLREMPIGTLVDAFDYKHKLYRAQVQERNERRIRVHFVDWTSEYDEWISHTNGSSRIRLIPGILWNGNEVSE